MLHITDDGIHKDGVLVRDFQKIGSVVVSDGSGKCSFHRHSNPYQGFTVSGIRNDTSDGDGRRSSHVRGSCKQAPKDKAEKSKCSFHLKGY